MIFKSIKTGQIATNCYIIGCQETKEGAIIDPGFDGQDIFNLVQEEELDIKYIINTHGHGDHIGANGELKRLTGAELLIHQADAEYLTDPGKNLSVYMGMEISGPPADRLLQDGDVIKIGNTVILEVLHTPGHTPGGISLKGKNFVFTGDTLFAGSVGRTDFPGGSQEELLASIKNKLLVLPGDYLIYPGHGPSSILEKEKQSNPFLV